MPLTVRQDNRKNTATALSTMFFTSHAQVSSSRYVHFAPGRAHGTCATSTPCSGHRTRGAAACRNVRVVPVSTVRHPPGPGAGVVPRARPPALSTPAGRPGVRAYRHHQNLVVPVRIDLDRDVLDDHALDAQQLPEYPGFAHAVSLSVVPVSQQDQNYGRARHVAPKPLVRHPLQRHKSRWIRPVLARSEVPTTEAGVPFSGVDPRVEALENGNCGIRA